MAKEHALQGGDVVGQTVNIALDSVSPNPWNPNAMTPEIRASLEHGLKTDGWLASQALLVWASDETGARKMLIIDGEHRWAVGKGLGFKKGPAVLLAGITEAKAKSLTVALNHRRGASEETKLRDLLNSISADFGETLAMNTGLPEEEVMKLLAVTPEELNVSLPDTGGALPEIPDGPGGRGQEAPVTAGAATVRMVQLFLDASNIDQFNSDVAALGDRYGTKNLTDTVVAAVKEAALLHAGGVDVTTDPEEPGADEEE